jgi:hypothetical protein
MIPTANKAYLPKHRYGDAVFLVRYELLLYMYYLDDEPGPPVWGSLK